MRAPLLSLVFIATLTAGPALSRPVVVELFTSEGCSSCPPADALLTELAGRNDVLPLAFHVTYWNALGWRDPYSSETATSRQARYAARLGGGSYTPEIVVDGRRGMVGSDRDAVAAAIATARHDEGPAIRLARDADQISVSVETSHERGRLLLVGYDPRRVTAVGRGENSGRTLIESNIVRSLRDLGSYTGAPLSVTASRGAGAEAAVLLEGADGTILGAARSSGRRADTPDRTP